MTKIEELKNKLETLKEKMQTALNSDEIKEAKDLKEEIINLKEKIELQEELDKEEKEALERKAKNNHPPKAKEEVKEFCNMARRGFPNNSMSEGVKEDGGYTVPEDIKTKIQEFRESKDSLEPFVHVVYVKTLSGQRTFKKRSQQTGFVKVAEGGKIQGKDAPEFMRQSYEVEKYAGYFPVTNELLEDTDENIVGVLTEWIGDESRVTRNRLIIATINEKEKVTFSTMDDIKKALNVTLDAVFRNTAIILTNQDGLQYFDTLKNKDGDYLLQPVVGKPTEYTLFGHRIKVLSNKVYSSDMSMAGKRKIPVVIGDLKEGIIFYDRKTLHIKSSDIAMGAFEEDLTYFRAIEREDVKIKDEEAFINGEIIIDDSDIAVTAKTK